MYDELIKALRYCGNEPYDITKPCKVSPWKLKRDAADAIERLQADNADLENRIGHQNVTIAELYKTIEKLTKEIQTR